MSNLESPFQLLVASKIEVELAFEPMVNRFAPIVDDAFNYGLLGYWVGFLAENMAEQLLPLNTAHKVEFIRKAALPQTLTAVGAWLGALGESSRVIRQHYPQHWGRFLDLSISMTIVGAGTFIYLSTQTD